MGLALALTSYTAFNHNPNYMKTPFPSFSRPRTWLKLSGKFLLPATVLASLGHSAYAQSSFPRFETFTTNSAANFRLGGTPNSAVLTGTTGTSTNGFLRLTNATNDQAGFIIDQLSFPAPQGFSISFEFFSYGGSGADGFSVFLIDADKTTAAAFMPGASGGSLGYAQKTVTPVSNGVPNGYIGIGIDEFGNFANPSEGRVGGLGARPDAVSIRGAGNGQSTTDYPYLAGSGSLPFSLDVGNAGRVTNPSDPNYRRAYIDVVPQGTAPNITYKITVRIQHGSAITKAIDNLTVATPPPNLRIGFSGSTGGSTNIHEIRNLSVVQSPVANDDVAGTIYNQPVRVNVLSNDQFFGSNFKPGGLDLDIATAGVQSTYTIAGQGTFTADVDGVVTFTPSGTFAGVITLPYHMQDLAGSTNTPQYYSNPANLTIIVEGADIATGISGPTSVNPGSLITYTANTSNLGTQEALNVIPTIQLPANLANVTVSSGSYNPSSGLVTFASIPSLAAGATPISNTVSFAAPASGSVTGTAGLQTPPSVPDPVATNNTSTITTTITGIGNVAGVCATPGKDGPGTLTTTSPTPDTYYAGTASLAQGATSIPVGSAVGSTPITAGDLLLVMQMQGAEINTTNTSSYGSGVANNGTGYLATNYTAGLYEYVTAKNDVPVAGGTLQLTTGLSRAYTNADFSSTGAGGQQRYQVIRVPQYSSLTVSGTITGPAWNGGTGGVLVLDVAGQTTFSGTSSFNMNGKGFRGGGSVKYTSSTGNLNTDYVQSASTTLVGAHASKGEGIVGTPRYVANSGAVSYNAATLATSTDGYNGGSVGRGAPGNAGGGGSDGNPNANDRNTGGGGGSNGAGGGVGGTYNFGSTNVSATGGLGGAIIGASSASRIVMGGGGGAGTTNTNNEPDIPQSNGGNGGGIIIFRTGSVLNAATIVANGAGGSPSGTNIGAGVASNNGAGGGGGGGTVLVAVQNTGIGNLTVRANGGDGGSSTSTSTTNQFGSGGGGGGGNIYANGTLNTASSKIGGTRGTSRSSSSTTAANGAVSGSTNTASNTAIIADNVASVGACLPLLDVALATSTPNVTRTGTNNALVNPALYVLTVSNTGGAASDISILTSLTANIFAYDPAFTPVATLQLANESAATPVAVTAPTTSSSTPTFSIASLPAGATLNITFRATITGTAQNDFAYQASATATYLDPTRSASQRTGPTLSYTTGVAAPGSNYTASNSTREDVTIRRPLPVELKRFEVATKGLNAELNWATASEVQNDRFELERSLDGREFERIGSVKGQGTTSRETAYQYTDANAARLSLKPIYYRLRQVDRDGASSLSPVRVVKFERGVKATIALYPNPHAGTATLDLTALSSAEYSVEVMDLAGRQVRTFHLMGGLEHSLDLNALPLGSYLIRVRGAATVITLPMVRN